MIASARSSLTVVGSTVLIYCYLIVLMRFVGRRQLAQLGPIDLAVILLLGSSVETAMIHGDTSLPAGLTSAGVLMVINLALTWALLRSRRTRHLVAGGPLVLVHHGEAVDEHLRRAGMTAGDLHEALRARGYADLHGVGFAVLEADGTVSVVPESTVGSLGDRPNG
jgi:uncharacterized membrane protein YcaP (DUF421 family)